MRPAKICLTSLKANLILIAYKRQHSENYCFFRLILTLLALVTVLLGCPKSGYYFNEFFRRRFM